MFWFSAANKGRLDQFRRLVYPPAWYLHVITVSKLEDGMLWIHVSHVTILFLAADNYFKLLKLKRGCRRVEFSERLVGIKIILVLVIGIKSITQLLEVLSDGVVGVYTQLEVAVLRCAFTMPRVFLNHALIGISTWVSARQCKPGHNQL